MTNSVSSTVSVRLRTPEGGYAPDASSPVPTASGPSGVAVADFDADTRPDLATSNGRVTKWAIRATKNVKITRACVRPGSKKTSRCPG